jgi:hypothetical protein
MLGDASGATGEMKWTSKTNRVLKVRVPLEFWTAFSVDADLKADEEARALRSGSQAPAPAPPPPVPHQMGDAIKSCVNKGAPGGMAACMQEAAAKICESATGADKESAPAPLPATSRRLRTSPPRRARSHSLSRATARYGTGNRANSARRSRTSPSERGPMIL